MIQSLDGMSILVTGATGSFGRSFVRTLTRQHAPARIAVFSRDEAKQYEMQQDPELRDDRRIRYFIGDVRDAERLELAMREVDLVVHAAALKQVPTAEYNPFECIHTNVFGAENVVRAAIRNRVQRVLALSTDKAANPINLYGASKLASDKIFIAANNLSGRVGTRFSVVRYGNVIGSRGSVIPFFRQLIARGTDHLPITDPRMTRFWLTLQQGVDFVVRCVREMQGGEIFVPKIPSMKVIDVARAIAPSLPLKTIGIRPGEKLHEVMITEDDSRYTYDMGDRFVIEPAFALWSRDRVAPASAKLVAPEFCYSSETNDQWLTNQQLLSILDTGS